MPIFDMELDQRVKTKKPSQWNVILYNDDITPFEFVESVLTEIFKKTSNEAMDIAQQVHNRGKAIIGTYIRDVAVTRCKLTMQIARENGFPLKVEPKEAE